MLRKTIYTLTPLFSAAAFGEDVGRICKGGARLALGMGAKPSYILSSALSYFASHSATRTKFEPNCIGHIDVTHLGKHHIELSLQTTTFGWLNCEIQRNEYGECVVSAAGAARTA